MIFISALIFAVCLWAVFTTRFRKGVIVKNFLSLSAIMAMLVVLDPINTSAFITSIALFVTGWIYWVIWHHHQIVVSDRRYHCPKR